MIQLLPHKDLYAIKVPLEATNYFVDKGLWNISCFIPISQEWYTTPTIGKGKWQILGEVTKDSISFDVSQFIVAADSKIMEGIDCEEQFYYDLTDFDLYFYNPLEKDDSEWQQYEDNLVEKVLIIQKL